VSGISAAFVGHGYCMGLPNPALHMTFARRMINTPLDSLLSQQDLEGAMHPNALGHAASAQVIADAILAGVSTSRPTLQSSASREDEAETKEDPRCAHGAKCCDTNDTGTRCRLCVAPNQSCP
jgi:hypothetical protein